jgi:chromosome segregation ATPase
MPKVSISEAARMAGKSRITIHRHIEKGLVSKEIDETGSPVIDVSELERVYGSLRHDTASEGVSREPHATDETSNDSSLLQGEIENLRERLSLVTNERERERQTLRETITDLREDRDRWRAQAERATRLLTDQRPEVDQTKRLEAELSELRDHRAHMSQMIEEQGRRLEELAQKPKRRGWWPWGRSKKHDT